MSDASVDAARPFPQRDPAGAVRRDERIVTASTGVALFRRSWTCPEPLRVILLVHGFAEHSGRYDFLAEWLARRACAVHAFDLRGHGKSSGRRGHIDRFEDLLDDLEGMLATVRGEHADLPCTLIGHSMGGLLVSAFAATRCPDVTAVVTSGAFLALSPEISKLRLTLVRMLRRVFPRLAMGAGVDPQALSRDFEVARRYLADPLVFKKVTVSLAAELMHAVASAASLAPRVKVPMLLLHGANDTLCPPDGSRQWHGGLSVAGSDLNIYPGLRHEIFNEPEREQVYRDLLTWIEAREAAA